MRCILVCVMCVGSTYAAHAAAGHFLLPVAAKGSKSAFRLPKQKALISARQVFSHTPADGSPKVLFYHPQTANALLLANASLLPSAWHNKLSPIHVGSLKGFLLSSSKCKHSTTSHIFSLADVGDCQGVSLCSSLVCVLYLYINFIAGNYIYFFQSVGVRIGCSVTLLST